MVLHNATVFWSLLNFIGCYFSAQIQYIEILCHIKCEKMLLNACATNQCSSYLIVGLLDCSVMVIASVLPFLDY